MCDTQVRSLSLESLYLCGTGYCKNVHKNTVIRKNAEKNIQLLMDMQRNQPVAYVSTTEHYTTMTHKHLRKAESKEKVATEYVLCYCEDNMVLFLRLDGAGFMTI